MRNNNVMGLIFSNMHDEALRELTAVRAMGSVPFGGRYRLIDFTLSNMVNAGISKVGIITKSNYQSLMDHIGSGKSWDLSRKNEGLYFLPPFGTSDEMYNGRIASLAGITPFLRNSKEELVILSDCHFVGNIDYAQLIDAAFGFGRRCDHRLQTRRSSTHERKSGALAAGRHRPYLGSGYSLHRTGEKRLRHRLVCYAQKLPDAGGFRRSKPQPHAL